MEERFGVKGVTVAGVFLTEQPIPEGSVIRRVQVEISRQNADLGEIKQKLASEVRSCGGNALANFIYGQRKHNWLDYILSFKWDTESWYGEGDALKL
jgi:hypothetical protein